MNAWVPAAGRDSEAPVPTVAALPGDIPRSIWPVGSIEGEIELRSGISSGCQVGAGGLTVSRGRVRRPRPPLFHLGEEFLVGRVALQWFERRVALESGGVAESQGNGFL